MSSIFERIAAVAMLGGLWWFIGGQSVAWGIAGAVGGLLAIALSARRPGDAGEEVDEQRADTDGFAQHRDPEDLGRWPFTKGDGK